MRIKEVLERNPREFWRISLRAGKTGSRRAPVLLREARGTILMEFPALELPRGCCEGDRDKRGQ